MRDWKPTVTFEDVKRGSDVRGDVTPAPVLPPEAYELAGLVRSGPPTAFSVAPARSDDRGQVLGRAGTAIVETPREDSDQGEMLLVRSGEGWRVVAADRARGGSTSTVFPVPVSPGPQGDRGIGTTAVRWVVQKVVFPMVDPLLGRISDRLVKAWETPRRPHRVRFYTPDDYLSGGTRLARPAELRSGPVLLLLHGTNSLSHSRSGLGAMSAQFVSELGVRYSRQVIAFDHPTLATDPVTNAQALAEWLNGVDADIEIDLLCHSRGGLLGRLLVEQPDLCTLANARITFRSITTVATPHRGTPLAEPEHLGRLVDRLLTIAAPLPDNPVTAAVEGALTLAKQVTTGFLEGLDGLSCMRPADGEDSWLASTLPSGHRKSAVPSARRRPVRYRAIAADFEPLPGSGRWHALRDAGVDLVFGGHPNDVVVPTISALSIGEVAGSHVDDMVVFDETDGITHSDYFGTDLAEPVLRAWLRPTPEPLPAASERRRRSADDVRSLAELGPEWNLAKVLDLTCLAPPSLRPQLEQVVESVGGKLWTFVSGRGAATSPPLLVLVPGIMGSELTIGTDRIWLSPWRLAHGAFAKLRLPAQGPRAEAADILCAGYRTTLERLGRKFQIVTFPYDWRDDLKVAADGLRDLLRKLVAEPERRAQGVPVHLVAHSMGGLVTRLALGAGSDGLREELAETGGRVVLAGTPNHGSIATPLALLGRHPVLSWLARVDLRASLDDWVTVARTFTGLFQLLPSPDLPGDPDGGGNLEWLYEAARWDRAGTPTAAQLASARALHDTLATQDGTGLHLVLGDRVTTPVAIRKIGDSFEVGMSDDGDGTVARRCGELTNATTYLARGVEHGNLVKDAVALQAIIDILERGSTRLLTGGSRDGAEALAPPAAWLDPADAELLLTKAAAKQRGGPATAPQVWTRRDALDAGLDALSPVLGTVSSQLPPLKISIVHGSVETSSHPVLVGHATATPISGAEGRCDELLGHELRTLQNLGLYPDTAGSWRFVAPRAPSDRIRGCVVLGLDSGEPLSRGVLDDLVTRAVIDYAERMTRVTEVRPAALDTIAAPALGLSSVAAGSSPGFGLGLERSVTAIVQGVQRANEALARVRKPIVEKLEFVDVYAGQVERIRWTVDRLVAQASSAATGAQPLVLDGEIIEGVGRREGSPPPEYGSGRWEHLSIDAEPLGTDDDARRLTYRLARSRAAASESPRRVDRAIVAGVLREAVTNPGRSTELGRVLFEELLPVELKDELSRTDNLVLQVDDRTADIPWELLGDRLTGEDPLACRVGMLRQLRGAVRVRPSGGVADNALVIGDPPSDLGALPEARKEATDIAASLRGAGMDVVALTFPSGTTGSTITANQVRNAFWRRDHRVIHVAAHGLYRVASGDGEPGGGVVIGPGTFLTADDFANLRATPDLVFLNCCYLGQVGLVGTEHGTGLLDEVEQHRAAASLASALITIGVKAVVVAGWPVDDNVASHFASEFYRQLLDGVPYGEAVKLARTSCFRTGRGQDNTWAAYQCYGDPAFSMRPPRDGGTGVVVDLTMRPVARRRVEDILARGDEAADARPLRAELDELDRQVTARWKDDGELLAALGGAFDALGDRQTAITRYRSALGAKRGSAPIRVVERLLSMSSRQALELHRSNGEKHTVDELVADAEHWLAALSALGRDSSERCYLEAGHRTRMAILDPGSREKHVARAIDLYLSAAELDSEKDLRGVRRAVQLAAVTTVALTPPLAEAMAQALPRFAAELSHTPKGPDFWAKLAPADSHLAAALASSASPVGEHLLALLAQRSDVLPSEQAMTERLIKTDLATELDELVAVYSQIRVGGFSRLHLRSVVEHVADLAWLAQDAAAPSAGPLTLLLEHLQRLESDDGQPGEHGDLGVTPGGYA